MLVALTPTGNRPEGFALLAEYLNAQTYSGALRWVVVDDCDPATRVPLMRGDIEVEIVRPPWRWRPGQNTQANSLAAGLERVPDDAVLFVLEDDDIYLPTTLSDGLRALEGCELAGERLSRYYNVLTARWRVLRGAHHASLASTVMRGDALAVFRSIVTGPRETMLDVTLWRTFSGSKRLTDGQNVIGIKGLPGRSGIGVGHRRNFGAPDQDDRLFVWAGDYAANYRIFREAA